MFAALLSAFALGLGCGGPAPAPAASEAAGEALAGPAVPSVAVLGWREVQVPGSSGCAQSPWFAALLAEMVSAELEDLAELRVASRREVAERLAELGPTAGAPWQALELSWLAGALGVEYVVAGELVARPGPGGTTFTWTTNLRQPATGQARSFPEQTFSLAGSAGDLPRLARELALALERALAPAAQPSAAAPADLGFPRGKQALELLGEGLARGERDPAAALARWTGVLALEPASWRARQLRARTLLEAGELGAARLAAEAAVGAAAAAPRRHQLALEALLLEAQGKVEAAAERWRARRRAQPRDLEAGLEELRLHVEAGDAEAAARVVGEIDALGELVRATPRVMLAAATAAGLGGDAPTQLALATKAGLAARGLASPRDQAAASLLEAEAALALGRFETAEKAASSARELAGPLTDARWRGRADNAAAVLAAAAGDAAVAVAAFDRAIAAFEAAGAAGAAAGVLLNQGRFLAERGEPSAALAALEQAAARFTALGNHRGELRAHVVRARLERRRGDLGAADAALRAAQAAAPARGAGPRPVEVLLERAGLAAARQEAAAAAELLGRALGLAQGIDSARGHRLAIRAHAGLAETLVEQDRLAEARTHQERAFVLAERHGWARETAAARLALAALELEAGNARTSAQAAAGAAAAFIAAGAGPEVLAAQLLEARAWLEAGDPEAAAKVFTGLEPALVPGTSPALAYSAEIIATRIRAARGEARQAATHLAELASAANRAGQRGLAHEASLAQAEAELAYDPQTARRHAAELAREARESGHALIARKAAGLAAAGLGGPPGS